jgi:hypothetical protein
MTLSGLQMLPELWRRAAAQGTAASDSGRAEPGMGSRAGARRGVLASDLYPRATSRRCKSRCAACAGAGFQLSDFPDDGDQGNGVVVLGGCEFVNATRKGYVGSQGFAEPDKGAHDEDVQFICTARSLLSTEDNMATPSSVKASGAYLE